jgi:hypothetical protein
MGVEAGVEKSHGHAAPGESLVCIHPQRRRENVIVLFKNKLVGIDLRLGPNKELDAVWANSGQLTRGAGVRLYQRLDVCRQVVQRNSLRFQSSTEVATQIRLRLGMI